MDADLESCDGCGDAEHEWAVRQERFYNDGYRDALDQGKTATVQQGFDAGFVEGASVGLKWGFLRGALISLLAFPQSLQPAQLEEVRDLQSRVNLEASEAASLACTSLTHERHPHSGQGPGAAQQRSALSTPGEGAAAPDRLQARAADRWQKLLLDALGVLAELDLRPSTLPAPRGSGPAG